VGLSKSEGKGKELQKKKKSGKGKRQKGKKGRPTEKNLHRAKPTQVTTTRKGRKIPRENDFRWEKSQRRGSLELGGKPHANGKLYPKRDLSTRRSPNKKEETSVRKENPGEGLRQGENGGKMGLRYCHLCKKENLQREGKAKSVWEGPEKMKKPLRFFHLGGKGKRGSSTHGD